MGKMCKVTRSQKYTEDIPSEIFQTLMNITKDKKTAQLLWGFSQENLHISKLKLPINRELTVQEFFENSDYMYDLMDTQEQQANLINYKDKLAETKFSNHTQALQQSSYLNDKYPQFTTSIQYSDGGYVVQVVPSNEENRQKNEKEIALSSLNDKLISYIESLGFAVKQVAGLTTPGVFAPKDAVTNAEGLIEAIKVSKNMVGKKAIPEEISHLLVAGMHNNPLLQRLKTILTKNVVKEMLGEQYEHYYNKYNGDLSRLQEEIIGKLVTQNLVDRYGLTENIQYISNKFLDKVKSNLNKGEESYIYNLISETNDIINNITDTIIKDDSFLKDLDIEAILSSEELYNLGETTQKLQQLAEDSYQMYAKKLKLQSFKQSVKTAREEADKLKDLEKLFEKARFYKGYTSFLNTVMEDCSSIHEELTELKKEIKDEDDNFKKSVLLKRAMKILTRLDSFISAYEDIVKKYISLSEIEGIEDELGKKEIESLEKTAVEINVIINKSKELYQHMRLDTLMDFYGTYWKNDIEVTIDGKKSKLTIKDVLESQMGDTTGFDRLVNSIADSRDPLLQLMHSAFQDQKFKMNREAVNFEQALAQAEQRYYEKTGSRDTTFIYALTKEGKLNGMYKSDIDYNAYYEAHSKKYKELKEQGLSQKKLQARMQQWRKQNTEYITISGTIKERVPKKSKYPSSDLSLLNEAQLEYYNDIINIKKQLKVMVPGRGSELYKAPQIKASAVDTILQKKNPKAYIKRIRDQYITTDSTEDIGFGELLQGEKYVVLDFNGNEVKRVPVFYNKKLDDMSQLNTNTTDAMIAYANMAVNYKHMNQLADAMDLTLSMMNDRDVKQVQGAKKMFYKYKVGDQTVKGDYSIKGKDSVLKKQMEYFVDANIYGRRKKVETLNWQQGDKTREFNYGKMGDSVRTYSTLIGMGLNEFSASSNIVMGLCQIFRESVGKNYFSVKDVAWAIKEYFKLRPQNAVNAYSNNPNDKLTLLLKKFDCLNDLNRDLNSTSYDKGLLRRILGKFNLLIGNVLGEHFLRSVGMLATLKGHKVLLNNNETTLYDVLDVQDTESYVGVNKKKSAKYTKYDIVINEDATELDGLEISLLDTSELIQEVNRKTQGGYADSDKGAIYESMAGRSVMQYRQWMPAMFTTRFGKDKINTRTGKIEHSDYRTAFTFLLGTIQDMLQLKFNIATRFEVLSKEEQANLRKVLFDSVLLIILTILLPSTEGSDDEEDEYNFLGIKKSLDSEDPWIANKFKLLGLRLKLELQALYPSLEFLKSNGKIMQNPIPASENINNILGLLDISSMSEEIASGRYEGWSRWAKNLYLLTPGTKNIERFVDLIDGETSMFKPYLD